MAMQATVKSILSSDTIVLRGKVLAGQIPKERVLHLEGLSAPRLGNRDRADEPYAFEAREYLRALLVGKTVSFQITYTVTTVSPPLEFGTVTYTTPSGETIDVALSVVKNGWAKLREERNKVNAAAEAVEEEEGSRKNVLKDAEEEAKVMARGVWSTGGAKEKLVNYSMPEDPSAFLAEWKNKAVDAIIEAAPNGSTVRARLILSPTEHQIVNVGLAGVRAPRSSSNAQEGGGEEFGDEARFFIETRLLQRSLKITLLSLPTAVVAPTAFNSSTPSAPAPPATMFLGVISHPAGNISALLLSTGLAKIVDWHAGFLSQSAFPTMMSELRKAEAEAKGARRNVWRNLPAPTPTAAAQAAQQEKERKWEGVVVRVWGADMLSVVRNGDTKGEERRLQLSSVRQPRPTDPRLAGLQAEGKELLRKKLIGKPVSVTIDYIKPAEGDFESRECATISLPSGHNVAVLLAEKGLVSILRHRQGDEQRSSQYDALMAAEAKAVAEAKGVHSGKEFPLARIIDASESSTKAAPFLSSLKRAGRVPGIVDFVASGSRFKIYIPKQDVKLTLVLSNIRAPRTARNASEKSEAFGTEAATFVSRKVLQRDVEVVVETTDKSGGFIGKLYLNGQDVAQLLVSEGLARVDDYSTSKELATAQETAQQSRKNIWSSYDAEAVAAASLAATTPVSARKEYVDVVVSDVRGGDGEKPFSFAVQTLKDGGTIPELERLMEELQVEAKGAVAGAWIPKSGEVVGAKFSADNTWYRARVRRANPAKKEAEVIYIDYGNSEVISYSRLRPLAASFKSLEGQAKEATLSFVTLLGGETEYGLDALDRFRDLCEGRQLVANIDAREPTLLHVSLFDPADPSSLASHESSINVSLVREGLARIDTRSRFRNAYPGVVKALEEAQKEAKRSRSGAYELGDVLED